jgi:hypothetical protein
LAAFPAVSKKAQMVTTTIVTTASLTSTLVGWTANVVIATLMSDVRLRLFTQKFVLLDRRDFSEAEPTREHYEAIKKEYVYRSFVMGDADDKALFHDAITTVWERLGSEAEFFYVVSVDTPDGVEGGTRPEDI